MKYGENQGKVYQAEQKLSWGKFANIEEAQAYADSLTSRTWWADRYSHIVRVEVNALHGNVKKVAGVASPCGEGCGVVSLGRLGLNKETLIHEMAHAVSPAGTGHSSVWVRNFLMITYYALGSKEYEELYKLFTTYSVDMG